MKFIGAHVSIAGGVENAPVNAKAISATAFAMFTKNQRQWKASPLTEANKSAFSANLASAGIAPGHVLPHDGYLINLAQPDAEKRRSAVDAFTDEIWDSLNNENKISLVVRYYALEDGGKTVEERLINKYSK